MAGTSFAEVLDDLELADDQQRALAELREKLKDKYGIKEPMAPEDDES